MRKKREREREREAAGAWEKVNALLNARRREEERERERERERKLLSPSVRICCIREQRAGNHRRDGQRQRRAFLDTHFLPVVCCYILGRRVSYTYILIYASGIDRVANISVVFSYFFSFVAEENAGDDSEQQRHEWIGDENDSNENDGNDDDFRRRRRFGSRDDVQRALVAPGGADVLYGVRSEKSRRVGSFGAREGEINERDGEEIHHWVARGEHDVVGTAARVFRQARVPRRLALVRETV